MKKKKELIKILILWFILGSLYFVIEGLWHIPTGGYANILMLPIGGLCGVCIGAINQKPEFYNMKMIYQCIISTFIILTIEFFSGVFLNLYLGLNLWDYSNLPFNILGQICPLYGILWFLLSPLAIWIEDTLRYKLWGEGQYYSLISIYKDLITYK